MGPWLALWVLLYLPRPLQGQNPHTPAAPSSVLQSFEDSKFQGEWFVLGLAGNTHTAADRSLLSPFTATFTLNENHLEVAYAMIRGQHCVTWSYKLVSKSRPGMFSVDHSGEPGADPEEIQVTDTDYASFALLLSRRQSDLQSILRAEYGPFRPSCWTSSSAWSELRASQMTTLSSRTWQVTGSHTGWGLPRALEPYGGPVGARPTRGAQVWGPSYPRVQPESLLGVSLLLGLLPTWGPFPGATPSPRVSLPQVPQSQVTPSHPGPPHAGPPPPGHPLFTQAPHHQALSFLPLPLHVIATCTHRQSSCLNIYHLHTHAHTRAQGGCPWVHTRSQACARPPHAHQAWPPGSAVSLASWALPPRRSGRGQGSPSRCLGPQPSPTPPSHLPPPPSLLKASVSTCVHVCASARVCMCGRVHACQYVHACVSMCTCVHSCACVHLCLPWSPPGSAPVPSGLHPEALSLHQTGQFCPGNAER